MASSWRRMRMFSNSAEGETTSSSGTMFHGLQSCPSLTFRGRGFPLFLAFYRPKPWLAMAHEDIGNKCCRHNHSDVIHAVIHSQDFILTTWPGLSANQTLWRLYAALNSTIAFSAKSQSCTNSRPASALRNTTRVSAGLQGKISEPHPSAMNSSSVRSPAFSMHIMFRSWL